MRRAFLMAIVLAGQGMIARAEDLPVQSCTHGKPHHCEKYGRGLCLKTNSLANRDEACEQWTFACVDCQTAIGNCFERSTEPVLEGSAECTACRAEMNSCMAAADKQYWPNRQ